MLFAILEIGTTKKSQSYLGLVKEKKGISITKSLHCQGSKLNFFLLHFSGGLLGHALNAYIPVRILSLSNLDTHNL